MWVYRYNHNQTDMVDWGRERWTKGPPEVNINQIKYIISERIENLCHNVRTETWWTPTIASFSFWKFQLYYSRHLTIAPFRIDGNIKRVPTRRENIVEKDTNHNQSSYQLQYNFKRFFVLPNLQTSARVLSQGNAYPSRTAASKAPSVKKYLQAMGIERAFAIW